MHKTFVLDTNVLLHDPNAMFAFEDNHVVIPIYVIEEIDNFKKDLSELGRNARQVARNLDALRLEGNLAEGVEPESGQGMVRVAITKAELPPEFRTSNTIDNRIMATALDVQQEFEGMTTLVTKDTNLRIRADALGLNVEDFDSEQTDISELYSGVIEIKVSPDAIDTVGSISRIRIITPISLHFWSTKPIRRTRLWAR